MLARALVVRPRYRICDELSSMLDVSTQAALLEAIAAIQAEQTLGVLLITHDSVLARAWCHEIADIRELRRGAAPPTAAPCLSTATNLQSISISSAGPRGARGQGATM